MGGTEEVDDVGPQDAGGRGPGGAPSAPGPPSGPPIRSGGVPRAELLGAQAGPWFTCGLGGSLLAQSALLFYGIVALVYAGLAALLWLLLSFLLMLLGCGSCGNCGGQGTCGPVCCETEGDSDGCCTGGAGSSEGDSDGCTCFAPASMVLLPFVPAGRVRLGTAHHPDHPDFFADVYRFAGRRWCIGCFTTWPAFLITVALLGLAAPPVPWQAWMLIGLLGAAMQAWSSLGRARTRPVKVAVKAGLGAGLGAFTHGVLLAPWPGPAKVLVLLGAAGVAMASAWPRARRMRAWHRAEPDQNKNNRCR